MNIYDGKFAVRGANFNILSIQELCNIRNRL